MRTYLEWARGEGCNCDEGVNGARKIYRITAPSGAFVMVAAIPDDEGLTPTMIRHLDRRLGVTSPFPAAPEPY